MEKQCSLKGKRRLFVQTLPFKVSLRAAESASLGFGGNVESQAPRGPG